MNINDFKTDRKAEVEGVWVEAGDGLRLKLGRLGAPEYQKHLQKLVAPHARRLRGGRNPELSNELEIKCLAKHILLDWENLEDNGESLPFSQGKALDLLTKYPDFLNMVKELADDRENFVSEVEEDAVKN